MNINKVGSKAILMLLVILIIYCICSSSILYVPQQTHAIPLSTITGIAGIVKIGIDIVGSLIDLYDTAKSHMTPKESVVTGNGIEEITTQRYYEAANSFDQALQLNRDNIVALNGKGILALHSAETYTNIYKAMNFFDQALQIDPNNHLALQGKGEALNNIGNYNEAIRFVDRALRIDPNDLVALTLKGRALTFSGNYNEAIRIYDKVLQIAPNDPDTLYERSIAFGLQECENDPSICR